MLSNSNNKLKQILPIILGTILLLPFIIISIYDRPSADDFYIAFDTKQAIDNNEGILGFVNAAWGINKYYYFNWQGLYTYMFVLGLHPWPVNEKIYIMTPICIIASICIIVYYTIRTVFKGLEISIKRIEMLGVSIVSTAFFLLQMPDITQGIYWASGAINYTPYAFLVLINGIAGIGIIKKSNIGKMDYIRLIWLCALSFFLEGGNHLSAFSNLYVYLLLVSVEICFKKRKSYLVFPFFASLIGFLLNVFAPGTPIRQARLAARPLLESIWFCITHAISSISKWINPSFIFFLLIMFPMFVRISKNITIRIKRIYIVGYVVWIFSLICGLYFGLHKVGIGIGGRHENAVWILFVSSMLVLFELCVIYFRQKYNRTESICNGMPMSLLVLALLVVFLCPISNTDFSNGGRAIIELSNGTAKCYGDSVDARIALCKNEEKEVWVSYLGEREKSSMLYFADILVEDNSDIVHDLSQFYNKIVHAINR